MKALSHGGHGVHRIRQEIQNEPRNDQVESAVSAWKGIGSGNDERCPGVREILPGVLDERLRDGSQATTDVGAARSQTAAVSAPVPHPTSSQSPEGLACSQSTNCRATGRLHRPMYAS
jgi:hypothetical protein